MMVNSPMEMLRSLGRGLQAWTGTLEKVFKTTSGEKTMAKQW